MTILHCMSAFRKNALNCCKQLTSIVHPDGVNLGCFQIGKLLFRNIHYPPELPDEEVELLKILERYLQSLRDGTTTDCRKNFDYGCCMVVQKLVRMNVFEVCKCISFDKGKLKILKGEFRCLKDKPAVQLDQLNVINNLEPALPSTQSSSESGENDNQKKVAYVINEDPTLERYCILRTTPTLQEFQKACAIEDARKEKEKLSGVKDKSSVKGSTKKTTSKVKSKANLKSETLESDEKKNYFSRSLCSYIQVCGSTGMVNLAHKAVLYYRYKSQIQKKSFSFMNMNIYNALLNCWAELGNMEKVEEVFTLMEEDGFTPDLQAYASYLECLVSYQGHLSTTAQSKVREISAALEKQGKKFSDIFRDCIFNRDQLQKIIKVLQPVFPDIANQNIQIAHAPYDCDLLKNLYEGAVKSPFLSTSISGKNAIELTNKQLKLEADYFVKIKSVNAPKSDSKRTRIMRLHLTQCEQKFRKEALGAIGNKLSNMWDDVKGQKCMLLYPYLHAVDKETLVHLLLQEIRLLAESAEYFSANIRIMCSLIGQKVMNSYFISLRKRNKVSDKIAFIHSKYVEYLLNPELVAQYTPREYWEYLKKLYFEGPTIDTSDVSWPHHILYEVGKFLYEILLEHLTFNPSMFQSKTQPRVLTRPFFTMYERGEKVSSARNSVRKLSLEIRAHPKLCKLYEEAKLEQLEFEASMVPMVCPPRPWVKLQAGGLLMTSVPFIRLPPHAHQQNAYYTKIPNEHLFPCFDSLNSLSLCPWIMNKPVLDAIIKVFQSGGCIELDIPLNPEKFSNGPKVTAAMTDKEKAKTRREKAIFKKEKLESGSLWFDCLYKLSIANHFRDMIFWFPHNLDFRGRVYPTPPHFNHLGSDLVRSMLLFAEGRPLGQNGLNWLKIHLINLTGLKKRESNSERLRYADEILEDILDSADEPFTGRQWWRTSDEPWQTLACCKEIANAVRSPDPVAYISHFPVHQDGSCNGLQHYAALGLDDFGAKEVNLFPADRPQDVYTGVASLVEEERKKDAAEGNEIAQALEGFVKRKVVKQTIMTFVYGVTEYGAKQQILKQLKDANFSEELCNQASRYLMKQTFASIQKMFTATREIQKWFTNSAECITKLCGEPVEWITPLGLPVIQPYHRKTTIHTITDFLTTRKSGVSSTFYGTAKASYESTYETYQLPNVRKQKNAFPPNFIHSLDSSHMMLTSLFCQRKGITFVSVHDCYWTHPQTIEIMNKVCREQFVSLHSQPILEDLSKFFLQKYVPGDNSQLSELQIQKLKSVLSEVPKKGSFNLQYILNSVYFFS